MNIYLCYFPKIYPQEMFYCQKVYLMKTKAIIDNFLYKIESFYRNFGNEWSINDFAEDENQKNVIKELKDKK